MESTPKKSVAFVIPLSSYSNLGNVGTLQSGNAEDLASSYNDDRAHQASTLESESSSEERQAVPSSLTDNSESYERSATKISISVEVSSPNNYSWKRKTVGSVGFFEDEERTQATYLLENKKLSEESPREDSELSVSEEELNVEGSQDQDQQNKVPMSELQIERNYMVPHKPDIKPVPKPREFKTQTASASGKQFF